jgi:Na+/alanine symporter
MKWWIALLILFGMIAAWMERFVARAFKSGSKDSAGARGTTILLNAALGSDGGHGRKAIVIDL